jgi:hypothetical protein
MSLPAEKCFWMNNLYMSMANSGISNDGKHLVYTVPAGIWPKNGLDWNSANGMVAAPTECICPEGQYVTRVEVTPSLVSVQIAIRCMASHTYACQQELTSCQLSLQLLRCFMCG